MLIFPYNEFPFFFEKEKKAKRIRGWSFFFSVCEKKDGFFARKACKNLETGEK